MLPALFPLDREITLGIAVLLTGLLTGQSLTPTQYSVHASSNPRKQMPPLPTYPAALHVIIIFLPLTLHFPHREHVRPYILEYWFHPYLTLTLPSLLSP